MCRLSRYWNSTYYDISNMHCDNLIISIGYIICYSKAWRDSHNNINRFSQKAVVNFMYVSYFRARHLNNIYCKLSSNVDS